MNSMKDYLRKETSFFAVLVLYLSSDCTGGCRLNYVQICKGCKAASHCGFPVGGFLGPIVNCRIYCGSMKTCFMAYYSYSNCMHYMYDYCHDVEPSERPEDTVFRRSCIQGDSSAIPRTTATTTVLGHTSQRIKVSSANPVTQDMSSNQQAFSDPRESFSPSFTISSLLFSPSKWTASYDSMSPLNGSSPQGKMSAHSSSGFFATPSNTAAVSVAGGAGSVALLSAGACYMLKKGQRTIPMNSRINTD